MMIILLLGIAIVVVIGFYFWAIMPRMIHKPDKTPFLKVLYAHRGLHDNQSSAPENSMAAFRKAVEAGYGIELDVQLSKDGIVVIFHDFTLDRVCGIGGKVSDYTYEELAKFRLFETSEAIPTLEEFLNMVDGAVPLIVELKVEFTDISACPAVDHMLREYQGVYCIESFNPLVLFWYRRNHKEVMRGQLSDGFVKSGEYHGILYLLLENLVLNRLTKPDFIAYNIHYSNCLSRRICRKVYRNFSVAYTVKSQEELETKKKEFDIFIFDSFHASLE